MRRWSKRYVKIPQASLPGFRYFSLNISLAAADLSVVFGQSVLINVLKFYIFLGCPLPGPLSREKTFHGLFCLHLLAFPGSWLLQDSLGLYEAKENSGNSLLYHSSGPRFLASLASSI